MTSDEIKKVREAAESSSYLPSACIMDYVPIMRNFIFSLVGTDGEQPVTDEWLLDEWGLEREDWGYERHDCYRITTRYQFRLLTAALGIKRRGAKS